MYTKLRDNFTELTRKVNKKSKSKQSDKSKQTVEII